MKVTIFGAGYVGLVTGACFAEVGHHVLLIDVEQSKIDQLNQGLIPIYEPGLDQLVARNMATGRLAFSTDAALGVKHGLFQFIAVGTPSDEDGSADLKYVLAVAASIGRHMDEYRIVVDKSTVPVGTADKVRVVLQEVLQQRQMTVDFALASNPEFLKEGSAIKDFMEPDRIIMGTEDAKSANLLQELYAPINQDNNLLFDMDIRSAELSKYAANALLATKISFMNELSHIAERVRADIEKVRIGIGSDPRIGNHFINPGCGYGGSCFPKDVRAIAQTAKQVGYEAQLLNTVEAVNQRQKQVLFTKISQHFAGDLENRVFAVWGLAFKPNTDDMREASSRVLIESLWLAGARVQAFDPVAMTEAARIYAKQPLLSLCDNAQECLEGADALIIVTEWAEFTNPDFIAIKSMLKQATIFDGRNLYNPQQLAEMGIRYYAIGRGINHFQGKK